MFAAFKKILALSLVAALFITAPVHAEEMTREQVEKIVQEYLSTHGDVILKAVDDFQRKDMQTRQADALKRNNAELFRNERSPYMGKVDGDVTIVEFFDYNCGYCKRAFPDMKSLIEGDKNIKVIFKDFPILGATSEVAAKWALAAQKQDKYFEFHGKLMEHMGPITPDSLAEMAKSVGLDVEKMKKDAALPEISIQLEKNRSLAGQLGLSGTPAFVIGDEVIPGAVPKKDLLEKVKEIRAAGGKKAAEPAKAEEAPAKEGESPADNKAP